MFRLPPETGWKQINNSYKLGSLFATKNINLDEHGVIKLSPRTVNIFDSSETASGVGSLNFDIPVAFGRYSPGSFYVATKDEPFNVSLGGTSKSISEDTSSNNPNLTVDSHGCWWQNRFYESTNTAISYNDGGTWTANVITGLTGSVRHYMAVFKNKNALAVSNGNTVKLYATDHSLLATLTLPSDFEVIGLAYNYYKLAIITRLGNNTNGQNTNAYFFTWDGATSEAGTGVDIGAYAAISVLPYASSFAITTGEGQALYWNGGGFDEMASFPFYYSKSRYGDNLNFSTYGDNMLVDGDVLLINTGFNFDAFGYKGEQYLFNNPSGVWCYDPKGGLYHKYSPSISRVYNHNISEANVNLTTNILTTSLTIPATGNPLIVTGLAGSGLGGIVNRRIYYIIKLSSTTFQIASTYENAIAGVAVDITSAASSNFLWLYDIKDYGASYTGNAGAIASLGASKDWYTDIIGGTAMQTTTDSIMEVMFMAVPFLDNIGYFITPKFFTSSVTEVIQNLVIKHRPLDTHDKIIVKAKTEEYLGLPVTSVITASTRPAIWTGPREFYTEMDLNEAEARFNDDDVELEIELISGCGAGQMVKIQEITESNGVYAVVLAENVVGAGPGLKSQFVINNWKFFAEVNSTNQREGIFQIPIAKAGKSPQFKIELRGIETAIEDIFIINQPHRRN